MEAAEGASGERGQRAGRRPTLRERVRGLSYWPEVEHRLKEGASLYSVAKLIQSRGDLVHLHEAALVQILDWIREKIPGAPAISLARQAATTPAAAGRSGQDLPRPSRPTPRRTAGGHRGR